MKFKETSKEYFLNKSTYVNLRCVNIVKDKALVYVGGGITYDSKPVSEWNEIILKSETILKIFAD